MGKGSHRPAPFNGPSKTGNPRVRGAETTRTREATWIAAVGLHRSPGRDERACALRSAGLRVRLDSRVTKVFRAAAEREARSSSPHDELQVVEARVDAELSAHERKSVAAILKA